ncbi:MAG: N-acetyltransferase [Candidatus Omnitrophica bacterium]|nr:N-acetyltransferase [Candidatus Omnitrophota bacterium]
MKVEHDKKKQKFWIKLDSYEAVLMYAKKGKRLDFYHIYVPDPFRNQGLAARILITAFKYAKKEGYRVIPSCPFIAGDFLPRFPKYQDLVEKGEFPFAS